MKTKLEVDKFVNDFEILGRELTKKLCEENNWGFFNTNNTSYPYDCFIDIGNEHCMGEIKVRDVKFKKKTTLHFEVKKYKKLKAECERKKADKLFYINWLGDECFIFNITDDLISKCERGISFSNKVTAESRDIENKVDKEMYFLPKIFAKRYILTDYEKIKRKIVEEFNLNI